MITATGDAFLCFWPATGAGDLPDAVARAVDAALEFQAAGDRHPRPGGEPLRTRIGIAAGELDIALVGGVNGRWELMPVGDPLDGVAAAERNAPTGGVILAPSAWEPIRDFATGQELGVEDLVEVRAIEGDRGRAGSFDRDLEVSPDVIAPFVPAPLRRWRAEAGSEWLAELRPLTMVMARLLGPAPDLERTQLAVRTFQETLARFEGASKPGMDNKGLTLSGAFGLPPRAHADDPERAVRAAAALRARFAELGLPCSIGVASGRAFCGLFGSDLRREYTISGDVTNLAARLAYAGERDGEILCDDATARSVGERFHFEPLPAIPVKGRAELVAIRRFVELRAVAAPRHAGLVNRERERALLGARVELLAARGERGCVVVEGDAGIGKSALVAEVAREAEQAGARVLIAAADAVERATSYFAWRPVFADVLGLDNEAPDAAELERLVLARIGGAPEIERLVPLLSAVLPVTIPDNETTAAMTGDVRADNTTMLLTRILSRLTATAPVLLVVEDAHWLDSNSWALLHEAVRSVPRLLAVVTTRPSDGDEVAALPPGEPLRISSLTAEHTSALVSRRLGVETIPADLSRFVEDRVAGHPFFAEALIRTMQEAGVVRVQAGATIVGDLEGLEMPSTVEGAVLSLVDRLTPGQQLTFKVAAVAGRTFTREVVSEAHPVSAEVEEDLEALVALDLVVPEADGYAFRHDITREVAYALLTESQRRPLHRAVAEWYERSLSPEELQGSNALLAHHWAQADDPARATAYLEKAGRQALRAGAFTEAALFYSRLLAQSGADERRRALWEKGEATAHYFLGDFERSRRLLEQAVSRLDRPVPARGLPMAREVAVATARQAAHLALPRRYRDRRSAEKAILDEAVDCYKTLTQITYLNGESVAEILYLELAGVNLGEEAGSSPHLARALVNVAAMASILNLRRVADGYAERAVRMADDEGQSEALAYVWNLHALIEAQRGRWRRGIAASSRALEVFGEIGDYNLEAELWQTRSALHICAADYRDAEACWTRTRELAARNSNPQLETWSLLDEVQTQFGRGATGAATAALDAALAIETPASDGGTWIERHYSTAATRLLEGRHAEAVAAADAVMEMVTAQMPTGFHWADYAAGAVEVYLDVVESGFADRSRVLARAAKGCRALGRIAWTFHGIRAKRWLLAGRLQWERGRREAARKAWRRALQVADRMEMEHDLARARVELVRHGLAGPRADAMCAEAIATFERLGADRQLEIARNI